MFAISTWPWLIKYLTGIIPEVGPCLKILQKEALAIEDNTLRTQALNSLHDKAFHCYGGAVLALLAPRSHRNDLIMLITALQTISDYLDNLSDRVEVVNERALSTLHTSMLAAVTPDAPITDYYRDYPGCRETTYLPFLVARCQQIARTLPSLEHAHPYLAVLIDYYSHLQSLKHLELAQRETCLKSYMETQVENLGDLRWWELAAATGSTLGMFALLSYSASPGFSPVKAQETFAAYFPWIAGLHILLDYLIDQEEDQREGDLNFTAYYENNELRWQAVKAFAEQAFAAASRVKPSPAHNLVVSGLLAMYLSDPKIKQQGFERAALDLLREFGGQNLWLYRICVRARRSEGF